MRLALRTITTTSIIIIGIRSWMHGHLTRDGRSHHAGGRVQTKKTNRRPVFIFARRKNWGEKDGVDEKVCVLLESV
jgi:hypothetical protein